ncbi:MAG: mannitol dehydrogenase family protein [Hyphomicrobiaceae bacterium]|nr:mannitol dehydrogenase family protein [Hyphomicrobiaceae bacterium]MCC0022642.1 mannitol dehydrogenase family protein [Hyphomicrobiaceae bacterium]
MPGIVHLGIGAFHRAHQAACLDDLLGEDPAWGIVGVSIRSPATRDALAPQDGLFTLAVRDASGTHCRVIGADLSVLHLEEDRDEVLMHLTSLATRIVTLTVTEKGYCHDPATGQLDESHPGVLHDLANSGNPDTAPGLLVEALHRRREAGVAPFTILSCDNLPANGVTTARIVSRFAQLRDPELGRFVAEHVAFPSTMVDRIVPATTDADRAEISGLIGAEDAWPVVTEPFSQWVIEDRFPSGRPAFEKAGVQMVDDVAPFEEMKLRMLNGPHSSLAYLGYLAGHQTVAETVSIPEMRAFLSAMMTWEIMPTLDVPDMDLFAYREDLLERFLNPALRHRTWQIAMDGSQKLPQRLLGTIRARIAAGASYDRLALGVAAWMTYVAGTDEAGNPIDVRDPLAQRFAEMAASAAGNVETYLDAVLSVQETFGTDLPADKGFRARLLDHLSSLREYGALATLSKLA